MTSVLSVHCQKWDVHVIIDIQVCEVTTLFFPSGWETWVWLPPSSMKRTATFAVSCWSFWQKLGRISPPGLKAWPTKWSNRPGWSNKVRSKLSEEDFLQSVISCWLCSRWGTFGGRDYRQHRGSSSSSSYGHYGGGGMGGGGGTSDWWNWYGLLHHSTLHLSY